MKKQAQAVHEGRSKISEKSKGTKRTEGMIKARAQPGFMIKACSGVQKRRIS